jgi:hypothetical protein
MRTIAVLMFLATTALASSKDDAAIAAMRATHVKSAGTRVVVWAPPAWPAEKRASVTASLDRVVAQVETALVRKHEAPIEYYISELDDLPSHVYGGYAHTADDKPVVFLSGLDSGEAPHIHETVHLVGGEFGSLLLREGIATYVQFTVQPGKMRPLVKLEATDLPSLDAAAARILGKPQTRQQALGWIANPAKSVTFTSRPDRGMFYAVSASFTAYLVKELGMSAFMEAYGSKNPVAAIEKRSGKAWSRWTDEWLKKIGA